MGYDIRLKVFTLRLKKYKKRKDAELLWSDLFDKFEGDPENKFNELFKQYIEHFDEKFIVYKNWPKAMMVPKKSVQFKSKNRYFYGQFEGGPTNQTFIVKRLDNSSGAITVDRNQVTTSPFYFIFHLPENSNVGLLITQSLGDYSMHDVLKLNFQQFIKSIDSEFMVYYNEKISKDAVESYKNGKIKSISIRKSGLSKDDGDALFIDKFQNYGNIKVELKVSFLDKITNTGLINDIRTKVLGYDPNIFEIEALEPFGLDENSEIYANFEYNGKQSLAKIDSGLNLSPTYIVEQKDVSLDNNNHPNNKEMISYLLAFMETMKNEIRV